MKRSIKIAIGALLFLSLNFFCKTATGNFSLNLLEPIHLTEKWAPNEELNAILSQEYRYLGHGNQAFVFASEDGEHVLKLFRPLAPLWEKINSGKKTVYKLGKLPFAQTIFNKLFADEIAADRDSQFLSYTNSFALLQEETGIEHLHLSPTTTLKRSMKIYDKIGVLHLIDLDSTSFLIQKKTDLLYPALAKLIKEEKIDDAKELLTNFIKLSIKLTETGIIRPTTLKKNLGCIGLKPIQIDVGKVFREEDKPSHPKIDHLAQIYRYNNFMKQWLSSKNEQLLAHFNRTEKSLLEASCFIQEKIDAQNI